MHTKALKSKGFVSQMLVDKPPLPEGTQLPLYKYCSDQERLLFPQRVEQFSSNELNFAVSD